MNENSHIEIIKCPECGSIETATVEHLWPWYAYVHECLNCKYIIMESEWDCVLDVQYQPVVLKQEEIYYVNEIVRQHNEALQWVKDNCGISQERNGKPNQRKQG